MSQGFQGNGMNQNLIGVLNSRPGIRIRSIRMMETPAYDHQFSRPYEANVNIDALNSFSERLKGSTQVVPSTFAGIGENILVPSAAPEAGIIILNGWDTKRLRFIMQVEVPRSIGEPSIEVVLGYTDYNGSTAQGAIDPNMRFVINSVFEYRSHRERTPMGTETRYQMSDRSHLIADHNWTGIFSENKNTYIRPMDVFTAMSRENILSGVDAANVFDASTAVMGNAEKSGRGNNIATNYVSSIVGGYLNAREGAEFGQSQETVMENARQRLMENSVIDDHFISAMSRITQQAGTSTFTWRDLLRLDPSADNVAEIIYMSSAALSKVIPVGGSSDWGHAGRITQVATMLAHSVAGLMMEVGVTNLSFTSTNETMGCRLETYINGLPSMDKIDMSHQAGAFVSRFNSEVMPDVTFRNQVACTMQVECDLFSETRVWLAYAGEPMEMFVVPSFADALLSPIVTNNQARVRDISRGFNTLMDQAANIIDNSNAPGSFTIGGTNSSPSIAGPFDNIFGKI